MGSYQNSVRIPVFVECIRQVIKAQTITRNHNFFGVQGAKPAWNEHVEQFFKKL